MRRAPGATSLALLVLLALSWGTSQARADAPLGQDEGPPLAPSGVAREMNHHFYERLRRDPWRALGWELLLPGAGGAYVGLRANAIASLTLSVLGAGLWTAGAALDREALWWAGCGVFAAGRTYGLVSAPVGAALLNAAFRRQLQIAYRF